MMFNKSQKIFCIGQNKTGTTSLKDALTIHDYKIGDQIKGENLLYAYLRRDFEKIKKYCNTATAFQDVPFSLPFLYVYLDQTFKGSKFILTVRNSSEQWYESITKFHANITNSKKEIPDIDDLNNALYRSKGWLKDYITIYNGEESCPYSKETLIKGYELHNENVKDYFKNNDNLLIIDISKDDSYNKFTKFLGIEPKLDKFPWSNKTE